MRHGKKSEKPKDWKRSVYVPIPKAGDKMVCSNYRTISLIFHTAKILLKIILKSIESDMERELSTEQAGFRRNRGTRDHIANMMERAPEFQQELFVCFIDYSKLSAKSHLCILGFFYSN